MTKRTFKKTRLEDLTGGMNTRDYASEIEDKQAQYITNWNFKGNRLVSEKGYEDTGNALASNIGAVKVDSGDIWSISNGDILKNGTIVPDGDGILIDTSSDIFKSGVTYYIDLDGNEYSATGLSLSEFLINIEAEISAGGYNTIIQDERLLVYKDDGTSVNYISHDYKSFLLYNNGNTLGYTEGDVVPYVFGIDGISYEGYYIRPEGIENSEVELDMMNEILGVIPSQYDAEIIYMSQSLEVVAEEDGYYYVGVIINKGTTFEEQEGTYYTYTVGDLVYSANGSTYNRKFNYETGLTIGGVDIEGLHGYEIDYIGNLTSSTGWVYQTVITMEGVTGTIPWSGYQQHPIDVTEWINNNISGVTAVTDTYPGGGTVERFTRFYKNNGKEIPSFSIHIYGTNYTIYQDTDDGVIHMNGETLGSDGEESDASGGVTSDFAYAEHISDQVNSISGYNAKIIDETNDETNVLVWNDMYSQFSISNTGIGVEYVYTPDFNIEENEIESEDMNMFEYSDNTINIQELLGGTGLNGRANITIGNLGNLAVDKDEGGAFYTYEGINVKISPDSIGEPTVGTIYNGKIVLGGYEDNDNIIFSKTSSPTAPLNLLNFSEYDSGGQSVSGGDKGLITGMIVGENGLYVFKDNSVWYSNTEKDDSNSQSFNLIFRKITSNGALTQNVITEVDQEIIYLDWKSRAVRRLGYEQNLTTLRDTSISKEIEELLEDLPEEQELACSYFKYPNYVLGLNDGTGEQITYNNGNTYYMPNKFYIYNVDNKSWVTRDEVEDILVGYEGYFARDDGLIYEDFKGNGTKTGLYSSKLYTFGDDIDFKKFGRFEIVGRVTPDSGDSKVLTVRLYIDDELIEEREYDYDESQSINEIIDLYDIGRGIRFELEHSGEGKMEIFDIQMLLKSTTVQTNYN